MISKLSIILKLEASVYRISYATYGDGNSSLTIPTDLPGLSSARAAGRPGAFYLISFYTSDGNLGILAKHLLTLMKIFENYEK